jgi:phage shock protein C
MEPNSDTTVRTSLDKAPLDRTPLDSTPIDGAPVATDPLDHGPRPHPASADGASVPVGGPAPAPGFRLHRSRTERMLGGVCGGLAESLGVDAALLRIGLVALTLLGAGIGVVLYVAAWILVPESDPA